MTDRTDAGEPRKGPQSQRSAAALTDLAAQSKRLDPYIFHVLRLIENEDWNELRYRTGYRHDPTGRSAQSLSFIVRLAGRGQRSGDLAGLAHTLADLRLDVPPAYFDDLAANPALSHVTARIAVDAKNPGLVHGADTPLARQLLAILDSPQVERIDLAVSMQPCLHDSLRHLGLGTPPRGRYKAKTLRGDGVVIGIVDDGCAFAHANFLAPKPGSSTQLRSRIVALWDQSQPLTAADEAQGWTKPTVAFGYGRELPRQVITAAVNAHRLPGGGVDDNAVYAQLGYLPGASDDLDSHGTHVMDIAAGNGRALPDSEGVAPDAEIVFVQLPPVDIAQPGPALSKAIHDAVAYIFRKAGNRPAVVNLSFGGNWGPHDGTWSWSASFDEMLAEPNRAIVVSAGNGFEQYTHASGRVPPGPPAYLRWMLAPEDTTPNDCELWYSGAGPVTVELTTPDGATTYGPFALGTAGEKLVRPGDNKVVGTLTHVAGASGNCVSVALRATRADLLPNVAPAAAGTWTLTLRNAGTAGADYHAWIHRDDLGPNGMRMQSRFHPDDANPGTTITDYASGVRSIAVGAFNTGTGEVCRYSACGPTRDAPGNPSRAKPDICAPAEEDVAGGGVLAASSRRALPTRMGGTSAAAPHVAGLVALILEFATKHAGQNLTADQIRAALIAGGNHADLRPNAHQLADAHFKLKQPAVWQNLIGGGRVRFGKALRYLFP